MSFVDDVLGRLAASGRMDENAKAIVGGVLEANRGWLEGLGRDLATQVMRTAFGQPPVLWKATLSFASQEELLAILAGVEVSMASEEAVRKAAVARLEALSEQVTDAALRVLSGVVLGLL